MAVPARSDSGSAIPVAPYVRTQSRSASPHRLRLRALATRVPPDAFAAQRATQGRTAPFSRGPYLPSGLGSPQWHIAPHPD